MKTRFNTIEVNRCHVRILVRKIQSVLANVHLSTAFCELILANIRPSAAVCEFKFTNVRPSAAICGFNFAIRHPSAAIWQCPASAAFWLQLCVCFAQSILAAPFCMSVGRCLPWYLALPASWLVALLSSAHGATKNSCMSLGTRATC